MCLVQEKLAKNKKKIETDVSRFLPETSRKSTVTMVGNGFSNMPLCKYSGLPQGYGDKEYVHCHEVVFSTSIRLPYVERIPPYTTWIFLDRYDSAFLFLPLTED